MILDKILSNLSVSVRPFALIELANGWRINLPRPPETLLHFVLRGTGRIGLSPRKSRDVGEGYMMVVPAGNYHALEAGDTEDGVVNVEALSGDPGIEKVPVGPEHDTAMIVACGLVDVRYSQSLNLFHGLDQTLVIDLSMDDRVRNAIDMIFAEQQHPVTGSETMTSALMLQCLLHMFRRLPSEGENALTWLVALRDRRLSRVIETVLEDPAANHTVESLSDVAAMSRSSFASLFSHSFDRTPMAFVNNVRMQRASELLEATRLSVDEVAARVGFTSSSHFAQTLKRHTGQSTRSFREGENAVST